MFNVHPAMTALYNIHRKYVCSKNFGAQWHRKYVPTYIHIYDFHNLIRYDEMGEELDESFEEKPSLN